MYVILRSTASEQVQLLAQPWMVRKLPPSVLQRGPWKIVGRCDERRLKLHYRRCFIGPTRFSKIVTSIVSMGLIEGLTQRYRARRFRAGAFTNRD